jgi:Viral BACON domain
VPRLPSLSVEASWRRLQHYGIKKLQVNALRSILCVAVRWTEVRVMRVRFPLGLVVVAGVCIGTASCDGNESPTEPTPVCSFAISPANLTLGPDGGTGNLAVTALVACAWTAVASAGWITVTAGNVGSGPGAVVYAVSANFSVEPRSGALTVGGQSHEVTQQGRSATVCSYALSPGSAELWQRRSYRDIRGQRTSRLHVGGHEQRIVAGDRDRGVLL